MASFSYIHWPYDVTNPIMHSLQPNYFTKDLKKLNLELSTIEQALSIWPEKTTIVSEAQAKLEIESVTRLIDGLGIDKQLLIQDIVTTLDTKTVYGTGLFLAYILNSKLNISKYIVSNGVSQYRFSAGQNQIYLSKFDQTWRDVDLSVLNIAPSTINTEKLRKIVEAFSLRDLKYQKH